MITNYIMNLLLDIKMGMFSLLPTLSTPIWAVENFPNILRTIMGFNYYIPVFELIRLSPFGFNFNLNLENRQNYYWYGRFY